MTTDQSEDAEVVNAVTAAMREADRVFEKVGGSTRHHVRDCLLPVLNRNGWRVVRDPANAPDATTELLRALDELYPVPDDAVRVERCGRTAAVVKRWMSRSMAEIEAMIPALIAQSKSGHDADCESELTSHGYTPCRCAERVEDR
jgi:hypothetical protein